MRLTEDEHFTLVNDRLNDLAEAEIGLTEKKRDLADAVWAAKRDGVQHRTIADWFDMTRDGLTKFLQRNSR